MAQPTLFMAQPTLFVAQPTVGGYLSTYLSTGSGRGGRPPAGRDLT